MHLVSLTGLPHILPSPCTTFSKSLSVNLHFHVDHVAQNAFNTRNNEASGLGNLVPRHVLADSRATEAVLIPS